MVFTIFTVLYLILLYVQQESQVAYGGACRSLPSQVYVITFERIYVGSGSKKRLRLYKEAPGFRPGPRVGSRTRRLKLS